MNSINLIFGCHSHQPVGNFDSVFVEAYEKAYVPFLDVLERFPAVRVTLHFTGPLWDWFAVYRPDYIDRIAGLVQQGQVEIMGGGYYEPLLCTIPERDAIAQIQRMQAFCQDHFGATPRGMWLTERVWEPHMARTLSKAGVEYTALDDAHFLCSGLRPDQLFGAYMTEDEGYAVRVFPIQQKLRYLIPFHQIHETIDYLREHASEDGLRCAVFHDDGEKFGIWPGTYNSVYKEAWLERFFEALTENQDWIHSLTYADYLQKAAPIGRTYLPCASYQEMMTWALPTGMQRELLDVHHELESDEYKRHRYGQFLRGGFWRNFLSKYDESNTMQKRMLRVSDRLEGLRAAQAGVPLFEEAEKLLHQGQCNCAYWHGVFGGLYLNHLRSAIYSKLIEADKTLDALEHTEADWVCCTQEDFDRDGAPEVILENSRLNLFLKPSDGGVLFELDYKDKPFNFLNTLSRREEPYHDLLRSGAVHVGEEESGDLSIHELVKAKEQGLENFLIYDPYRRVSLRDHFFNETTPVEAFWTGCQEEYGDFSTGAYTAERQDDGVTLTREAALDWEGKQLLRVSKRLTLPPDASQVEIRYDIAHRGSAPIETRFGVEFAANLLTGAAFDRYYWSEDCDLGQAKLGEQGCDEGLRHIALRDDWQQVECAFHFSEATRIYRFSIDTVSQSEGGQERVYQGSIVIPSWQLRLAPGEKRSIEILMSIVDSAAAS